MGVSMLFLMRNANCSVLSQGYKLTGTWPVISVLPLISDGFISILLRSICMYPFNPTRSDNRHKSFE